MYLAADNLDDLLRKVITNLLKKADGSQVIAATRGAFAEQCGVLLKLKRPRARLSRTELRGKIFSPLGELLWYLAASNDVNFIKYYAPKYAKEAEKDGTVHGAYGPRLIGVAGPNQIENVVSQLNKSRSTRRAVIQLFDAKDIDGSRRYKDVPCTCSMQFLIRDERLNMYTSMRSNDAFIGLSHDIFTFTMLQEIIARKTNVKLGDYNHFVGNLHLYDHDWDRARSYLDEGWAETKLMPNMPFEDPSASIKLLLEIEEKIRNGESVDMSALNLHDYWKDLARLLQVYNYFTIGNARLMNSILKNMSSPLYDTFIQDKVDAVRRKAEAEQMQLSLNGDT